VKIVDLRDNSISQVSLRLDAKNLLRDVKELVKKYKKRDRIKHTNNISLLFCSNSNYLAISYFRKAFYLYNMKFGKLQKYDIKYPVVNFAFSPNSRWFAIISSDKFGWYNGGFNYRAELFDLEENTVKVLFDYKHISYCMGMYRTLKQRGYLLDFSSNNKYLVISKLWDGLVIYNLEKERVFAGGGGGYIDKRIRFSDNGKKMFYSNCCGACYLGDLREMLQPCGLEISTLNPTFSFEQGGSIFLSTPDARYLLLEGCLCDDGYPSDSEDESDDEVHSGRVIVVADFSKQCPDSKKAYIFRHGGYDDPCVVSIDFSHDYHYIISVLQDGQVYMHRTSDELRESNKPYVLKKKYEILDEQERTESIKNNDFGTSHFSVNLGGGKKLHCCKSLLMS